MEDTINDGANLAVSSVSGERRQVPRTAVLETIAGIIAVDLGEGANGIVLDLGPAGMMVQSITPLTTGSSRVVSFTLPSTSIHLRFSAIVVWSDPEGRAGLRFNGLPERGRQELEEWLTKNIPGGFNPELAFNPMQPLEVPPQFLPSTQPGSQADSNSRLYSKVNSKPVSSDLSSDVLDLSSLFETPIADFPADEITGPDLSRIDIFRNDLPGSSPLSNLPKSGSGANAFQPAGIPPSEQRSLGQKSLPSRPDPPPVLPLLTPLDQMAWSVVEEICRVTPAQGAVVAISEGSLITCRASHGNAPAVGARLQPEQGLSGECYRTGKIVLCNDAEIDPRVPALVSQRLNLKSILVVPILGARGSIGLLEALSTDKNAFSEEHIRIVSQMAATIAGLLEPAAPGLAAKQPTVEHPAAVPASGDVQPKDVLVKDVLADLLSKDLLPKDVPAKDLLSKDLPPAPPLAAPASVAPPAPSLSVQRPVNEPPATQPAAPDKSPVREKAPTEAGPVIKPPSITIPPAVPPAVKTAAPPVVPPANSSATISPAPATGLELIRLTAKGTDSTAIPPPAKPTETEPSALRPPVKIAPVSSPPSYKSPGLGPAAIPGLKPQEPEVVSLAESVTPERPKLSDKTRAALPKFKRNKEEFGRKAAEGAPLLEGPDPAEDDSIGASNDVSPDVSSAALPTAFAATEAFPSFAGFETSSPERRSTSMVAGIAAVILIAVLGGLWSYTHREEEASQAVRTVMPPAPAPVLTPVKSQATPAAQNKINGKMEVQSSPSTKAPATQAVPAANVAATAAVAAKPSVTAARPIESVSLNPPNPTPPAPAEKTAEAKPADSRGASNPRVIQAIRMPSALPVKSEEPVQPPQVYIGAGTASLALPSPSAVPRLSAARPAGRAPVDARLIRRVEPVYPAASRNAFGTVVLSTIVDRTGRPSEVQVVSGSPILAQAAKTALLQWRYEPATIDGQPVSSKVDVKFVFTPR
ncbi:MAG TPA: TonB family protein [Terriglobales bacterium]|nr:TonB family protein [Terriglobales bacterium]